MGQQQDESTAVALLRQSVEQIHADTGAIRAQLERVVESLSEVAELRVRQQTDGEAIERAFNAISKHAERIAAVEIQMPVLNLVKGWVITGIVGVCGLLGVQMFAVVMWANIQMKQQAAAARAHGAQQTIQRPAHI